MPLISRAIPETDRITRRTTQTIGVERLGAFPPRIGIQVDPMTDETLQLISLIERLHRRVLHNMKVELEALGVLDISNVQAIMLLQIADADVTIGELALRGSNLLSNVSYNVKRMVANGYLMQKRSKHDRRVVFVRSTQKSRSLCRQISKLHQRQAKMLQQQTIDRKEIQHLIESLSRLDNFWISAAEVTERTVVR